MEICQVISTDNGNFQETYDYDGDGLVKMIHYVQKEGVFDELCQDFIGKIIFEISSMCNLCDLGNLCEVFLLELAAVLLNVKSFYQVSWCSILEINNRIGRDCDPEKLPC